MALTTCAFSVYLAERMLTASQSDPNYRSKLTIENTVKDAKKPVARRMDNSEGKQVGALNPGEIVEVNDGNTIHVVLDILMTCVCSPCVLTATHTQFTEHVGCR